MPPHPLTNFEIQKNELKFNGVHSRNNLLKMKNGAYVINLGEWKSVGTHWKALYVNAANVYSFGAEHFPKEITKFTGNKNILTNVYRTQAYDSLKIGYFCIGFIDFKSLLDYTNLFFPNEFEKKW